MHVVPRRKYVSVYYDRPTQQSLREWCMSNGFDLTQKFGGSRIKAEEFEFHTTIMCSETVHILPLNGVIMLPSKVQVFPDHFEMLGENLDIPVMKVKTKNIDILRSAYEKFYKMEDKWPEWKPHISLSYVRAPYPKLDRLSLPSFPLVMGELRIEDVVE